jgi:DNA-binding ferritin-like protein
LSYKKKYSKGFGGGYGGYKSGYMAQRDPLAAYRHTSPPMSEYDRKIRNKLEKPELSGMSRSFESDSNTYKINAPRIQQEARFSQKEVDEFSDKILHDAMEKLRNIKNGEEIPAEKYEMAAELADRIAQRSFEIRSNPEDKTTVLEFTKEFLDEPIQPWHSDILEQVDKIRNQMNELKSETLEVRESMPEFEHIADEMKKADEIFSGSGTPSETLATDRIVDQYSLDPAFDNMTQRKRRDSLYDSGDGEL